MSKGPRPEDVALGNPLEGGEKQNLRAVANIILGSYALAWIQDSLVANALAYRFCIQSFGIWARLFQLCVDASTVAK